MATSRFLNKDQDWNAGATTYWFEVEGDDADTGRMIDGLYGVVESGSDSIIINSFMEPLSQPLIEAAVRRVVKVTDELRAE